MLRAILRVAILSALAAVTARCGGELTLDLQLASTGDAHGDASIDDSTAPPADAAPDGTTAGTDADADAPFDGAAHHDGCAGMSDCQDVSSGSTPTPVCDTATTHTCVECLSMSDCPAGSNRPHCDQNTHTCVSCLSDEDCNNPGMVCNKSIPRCATSCTKDSQCSVRCYTTLQYCVECLTMSDCSPTMGLPLCLPPPQGLCVQCLSDSDCPGSTCGPAHRCS
jgi:hypothetical protein